MADERIEIETNIDVTPSIAALKQLKKQLRETTDPAEFRRLQQQIDDTQEAINAAKAGAGNFADVLGNLPGPIGDIAGKTSGLVGSLKQFGQIKLTDIRGSFVELGNDLTDVAKGFANMTGITKVYTVLNQALARSFVAVGVGEGAAAAGARAFAAALTATGIGAIVVALGLLIANWDKVVDAIKGATFESKAYEEAQGDVTKSLTDFNRKLLDVEVAFQQAKDGTITKDAALKKYNETLGASIGFAKSFEQAEQLIAANAEITAEQMRKRAEANFYFAKSAELAAKAATGEGIEPDTWQTVGNYILGLGQYTAFANNQITTYAKNQQQASVDAEKFAELGKEREKEAIALEAQKKKGIEAPPDYSKQIEARQKDLADIKKSLEEAELFLMGAQEREIAIVNKKYEAQIALAKKYKQDTTDLETAQLKEITDINNKYLEKENKELLDKELKQLELQKLKGLIKEDEYQKSLLDIAIKFNQQKEEAQAKYDNYLDTKRKENLEKEKQATVDSLQVKINELDKLNQLLENDFLQDQERLAEKKTLLQEQRDAELKAAEDDTNKQIEIRKRYADLDAQVDQDITNSRAAQEQARRDIALQYADVAQQLGSILQQAAGKNKALAIAGLVIEQAAGVARIVINTQAAAAKAGYFTPVGIATLAAGALSVTAAVIATKKGIDQIRSQQIPGGGGGGGGSASTPSATAPSFSAPRGMDTPQIQSGAVGTTPQSQLAQTIGQAQNRPIVAQVVSSAVSSQQALDRRNAGAATFGP